MHLGSDFGEVGGSGGTFHGKRKAAASGILHFCLGLQGSKFDSSLRF